ncbi:MAG: ATP-dependent DNA helicase [Corynebacterium sp.]|nr:ATP-dependent DNA helicase [Corynebacterium sp.]
MNTPQSPSTLDLLSAAVDALGGAERVGQKQMAQAVTAALEGSRHLAVQAGTGTGKSLAYLVPAIRHALENDTTVIVSTATIALQNQLVDRDLPRLVNALAPLLDREPTFAIMKGRQNYACLHRISQASVAEDSEALLGHEEVSWVGKHVARVFDWAQTTDTGDRDELTPGVPDIAWRQVSVSSQECLGAARCPHGVECFAELAKRSAAEADIVVTNHALLAIDAASDATILPEHDVVIIDEAHELDARITSVSTAEITARALKMAATRARPLGAEGKDIRLAELADEFAIFIDSFDSGRWVDMDEASKNQLDGLYTTLISLKEAIGPAPEGELTSDPEKYAERQNLKNHVGQLADAINRILEVFATDNPAEHDDVVWVDDKTLAVAPLSVADLLRTNLFGENTVVLTSATLVLGGRFDAMAAQWGLPAGTWDSLDVGTPFDPAKAGILYVASHLPAPGRDGLPAEYIAEMKDLIMAAGGRTLGLFSSRRACEEAAEKLRPFLPFELFVQGEDTTGALVEKFRKNENSCLFGTLSLWQGVDVPGPACSLVIIDRIPFPRPDQPLLQARTDAANAAGRSGFMEVSATHAALLMAQGVGRLLRSTSDRGVVAVLDNRLETKRYGSFLRGSLPAFWYTTNPDTVRGALKRLIAAR